MTERQQYGDEIKASVLAALLAGQSVGEIARQYNLPEGTVKSWKNRSKFADQVATDATQKKEIGELLMDYLQTNLATLKAQAEMFADKEWLAKQSASEVAVLHGVMTDKAIRLLEALSRDSSVEGG
jgi:transposase-like protein